MWKSALGLLFLSRLCWHLAVGTLMSATTEKFPQQPQIGFRAGPGCLGLNAKPVTRLGPEILNPISVGLDQVSLACRPMHTPSGDLLKPGHCCKSSFSRMELTEDGKEILPDADAILEPESAECYPGGVIGSHHEAKKSLARLPRIDFGG